MRTSCAAAAPANARCIFNLVWQLAIGNFVAMSSTMSMGVEEIEYARPEASSWISLRVDAEGSSNDYPTKPSWETGAFGLIQGKRPFRALVGSTLTNNKLHIMQDFAVWFPSETA
jgi:hypothetical protein